MDMRKIATRNAEVDRFGAGGEEQRAEALPAAIREPDFSGLGIDRDRAGAELQLDPLLPVEIGRAQRYPFLGRIDGKVVLRQIGSIIRSRVIGVSSVASSVSTTVEYMGPLYLSWETVEASGRLPAPLQCHIFVIRAQAGRRPRGVDLRRRHSFTPRYRRSRRAVAPSGRAGTEPRRPACRAAPEPSACPCSICPAGRRATGCRTPSPLSAR